MSSVILMLRGTGMGDSIPTIVLPGSVVSEVVMAMDTAMATVMALAPILFDRF